MQSPREERKDDGCAKFASPVKARHEEGREDPKIRERERGRSERFFPTKEGRKTHGGKRIGHAEYFIFEEARILLFAGLRRSERRQIRRVSLSTRVSRVFVPMLFRPRSPGQAFATNFLPFNPTVLLVDSEVARWNAGPILYESFELALVTAVSVPKLYLYGHFQTTSLPVDFYIVSSLNSLKTNDAPAG